MSWLLPPWHSARHRNAAARLHPVAAALRPVCETMEDRILHSADLAPLSLGQAGDSVVLQQDVQLASANDPVRQQSHEIVFVDLSVPDAQTLLDDLQAQRDAGRALEIITITADEDGIARITDTLATRSDITAVHLLAHGSDGMMQLGQSRIDAPTLLARADAVAGWGRALGAGADLLLYGCDFAQTGVGQQLVRDLAALTGADVAASTDTTGAVAYGGNWTLEFGTGPIEAPTVLDAAGQQAWSGTLAVGLTSQSSDGTSTATTSYSFAHNINGGSDRVLLVSLVLGNSASNATAVEFNGMALGFVAAQNSPTGNVRVELWSLVAPAVGAGTVNITLSTASTLVVGATSYSGVDQAAPIGTPVKGSGNGSTASVVVPASANDLVVDILGARQVSAFGIGANQTQNFMQIQGTGAADLSALSTRESGAASVTMDNTLTSADTNWASVAVQLRQSAVSTLLADAPMGTSGNLSGSSIGGGWASNWGGAGSKVQLGSGSLVDPSGLLPVSGGSAQFQIAGLVGDSATAFRNLSTSVGADGTTTWISFLVQPDPSGLGNRAGLEFGSTSATVGFAGFDGNQFVLGVAGGAQTAVSGITASAGQTVLMVLKLEHLAGNDNLTLYINPTPGLAGPVAALTATRSFDLGSFTRIALSGNTGVLSGNSARFDEIRVGRSFADVAPTAAPVIISDGGGASASISIAENKQTVTTVRATDNNSPSLTYSISGGADAALFTVDSNSGVLRFKNAPDFETPLDAGANNVYDVIVRVSDGSLSDTQAIAVSVVDVASGPITVTTTNDVYDGDVSSIEALIANRGADGKISLREAITAANNTVGTDTILFGIDGTFTISALLGSGDDNNTKGDFDVKDSLVIIGNGVDLVAGTANTVIAGLGSERVFDLRSGAATVTMSGLKIQGGGGEDGGALRINSAVTATLGNVIISGNNGKDGGAIYNDGRLTISRATISGNTAVGNDGGAIYNTGTLTLSQLELAGNVASGGHKGGAIYNKGDASLTEVWAHDNSAKEGGALWISGNSNQFTLDKVTLSANTASEKGGAIFGANNASLSGSNVTLSGNSAGTSGGAIFVDASNWTLSSSTIAYNHAGVSGGAFFADSANNIKLKSSILASNTQGGGFTPNNSNIALQSKGYNIATESTPWLDKSGDIISSAALLKLDTLAFNGASIPTHALLAGSTAIDVGAPDAASTDARGIARVGRPDIGAYENNAGNAAPTISPIGSQATNEDTPLGPLAFIIGDDGGTAALTVSASSSNATLLPPGGIALGGSGANRTITLTPAANANSAQNGGPVTVRITVSDGTNTTVREFQLTVNAVPDNPVAVDDLASTPAATPVVVSVLGNDYDVDGDSLVVHSAVLVTPSDGSVSFTNSTITVTPAVTGTVLVQYTVRDSTGRISGTAMLTVTVGVNNPPTASGGTKALAEDGSSTILLADLGYSDAPDNHAFAGMRIDSLPGAGSLWLNGDMLASPGAYVSATDLAAGKLVFRPAPNANGNGYASFSFSVQDSQGAFASAPATLVFDVAPQADPPTVVDDSASTPINVPVNVQVLANDSHPDGLPITISSVVLDDSSLGTVSISTALDPRGSVLFTPASNVSGLVVIRYTVQDSAMAQTVGTLRVTVGANTAPTSADNTVTIAEDSIYTVLSGDIAFADPDAGQSFAALRIDALPPLGTLFIDGMAADIGDTVTAAQLAAGKLVYQPLADGNGANYDGWQFSVVDSAGGRSNSYRLAFDVTPVNDAPIASGSAALAAVNEDALAPTGATVASLFGANFSDTTDAGNPAQNQLAGVAVTGQSVVAPQGRWQYSIDGGGSWQNISPVADASALALRSIDLLRFLPGSNFSGTPSGLTVRLIDNFASVAGGATINVSANGGGSAYSAQTVTLSTSVDPVNDAPTVQTPPGGTLGVTEDVASPLSGISFSDVDAGSGIVTATFSVASGTLSAVAVPLVVVGGSSTALTLSGTIADINNFLALGGLLYTTAPDATGNVALDIAIDDGGNTGSDPGLSGTPGSEAGSATVLLLVASVNDAPTASVALTMAVVEDTATALTGIEFADVDAGGGSVTATMTVASGTLSASAGAGVGVSGTGSALTLSGSIADINAFIAAGRLQFTTASGAVADVLLGVTINDGGNTGTGPALNGLGSSTLRVTALNKAPAITAPAGFTVTEDVPASLSGIQFADPDAGAAAVTVRFDVDSGSLSAASAAGVAVTGGGSGQLTLVGSIADINQFIADGGLVFTTARDATGDVQLLSRIDDGGNTGAGGVRSASASSVILVTPVNDAPVLVNALANRSVSSAESLLFQIPVTSFSDPDAGDSLQYSATLASGDALPRWLRFDPQTRTFSGTPGDADAGALQIRVLAQDNAGARAQAQFVLLVVVAPAEAVAAVNDDTPAPTASAEPKAEAKAEPAAAAATETGGNAAATPPAAIDGSDIAVADTVLTATPGFAIDANVQIAPPRPALFVEIAAPTPVAQGDAVLAQALTTQFSQITRSDSSQLFSNDDLLRKLEELRRQMEQPGNNQQVMTASSIALTSGLSIGYVIWLVRGGILVSSMLSALPAWQMIDPLPVLATSARKKATDTDEPGGVDALFDEKARTAPTPTAGTTAAATVTTPAGTDAGKTRQEAAKP
jgi:predicted outer membrane repeat protein